MTSIVMQHRACAGEGNGSVKLPQVEIDIERRVSAMSLGSEGHGLEAPLTLGCLMKWLNSIRGYHERFFVLDRARGTLVYHKCRGEFKHQLPLALADISSTQVIGEQVGTLQRKVKRKRESEKQPAEAPNKAPARDELSLVAATIRESAADPRKFYVQCGGVALQLRAESVADRCSWIAALRACKQGCGDGLSPTSSGACFTAVRRTSCSEGKHAVSDEVMQCVDKVASVLAEAGVSEADSRRVTDTVAACVAELHSRSRRELMVERERRRILFDFLRSLEDDKHLLETEVMGEAQLHKLSFSETLEATSSGQLDTPAATAVSQTHPWLQPLSPLWDGEQAESGERTKEEEPGSSASSDDDREEAEVHSESEEFFDALEMGDFLRLHQRSRRTTDESVDQHRSSFEHMGSTMGSEGGLLRSVDSLVEDALELGPAPRRRGRLPPPKEVEQSISLWSLIKSMIGKDLTRVCLPVYFNEPISALQKVAEEMEYSALLDAAAAAPKGSVDRLVLVAAFAVSGYCSTCGRTSKPFNPLEKETYEFVSPENGFRMLVEKVCHHPTVLAMHAEGRGWTMCGDVNIKSKFFGRCIELSPLGTIEARFSDGEVVRWSKVTTTINNLIIGKLYVDHYGTMKLQSSEGLLAKAKFKEQSFMEKNPHQVKGHVEDAAGNKVATLNGTWDGCMFRQDDAQSPLVPVWQSSPPACDPTRYNLTAWAITLNELTENLAPLLPMTDSRLRPDQKYLEQGEYTRANAEKLRLEQKQRAARKQTEAGQRATPRWFRRLDGGKEGKDVLYEYVGGYWESRAAGKWDNVKDIFGA